MRICIFDFEVFMCDWTVTFYDIRKDEIVFIHNDTHKLREYLKDEPLLCGWNNKWYDDWILMALLKGADNFLLKSVNDWIISGKPAWEHFFLTYTRKYPNTMDIRNDCYQGIGLKEVEGNLGMSIEESQVPFDIERPLTQNELNDIKRYNIHDVKATYELFNIRKNYLKNKIFVGDMIDLPQNESMSLTNAKLASKFLKASKRNWTDERIFELPKNLNHKYVPKELISFFNLSNDPKYSDYDTFSRKLYLDKDFNSVDEKFYNKNKNKELFYVYGYGGVHAGLPNYIKPSNKKLYIADVSSLYPTIMIEYDLLSRNVPNPKVYEDVYDARLKAKSTGEKKKSDALKLILNSTYGAMLNQYNDLYDPKMGRHVPIYGQLFLTELLFMMKEELNSLVVVNFNTDGITFELDDYEKSKCEKIFKKWEKKNNFKLDKEIIEKYVQKDVNNYIALIGKKIKTKGSMVKCYGGGNFESNSTVVVANAIVDYFLYDIPVEETISKCDNILEFQFIAKTGSSYLTTFYSKFDGENHIKDYQEVQKVNRVYASKDKTKGTLYKYKSNDGVDRFDKIANIPMNCEIDNNNEMCIKSVDKSWYIDYTKYRINQFEGGK